MIISFKHTYFVLTAAGLMLLASCNSSDKNLVSTDSTAVASAAPAEEQFKKIIDGKSVGLYTLTNKNGAKAMITNYGGRIVSLFIPDQEGKLVDVVAGFDSVEGYQKSTEPYFGATIGRFGNRIAKGKFMLDGKAYTIFTNNGSNTLHGGKKGFQAVVWDANQLNPESLALSYFSKDMEEGFPGNLTVKVTYQLTDDNELKISYTASTDKNTVVNLTNHAFFNLNGESSGTILGHEIQINADQFTPVDSTLIPTGKQVAVKGTPFDFNKAKTIGAEVNAKNDQLVNGKGYDHNYVLKPHASKDPVAVVTGDKSGIVMSVYTDQPGLQFYSGNFMLGKNKMKGNHKDDFRTAFALETQHFPDSPNQPSFPSTVLKPGETYKTESTYKFTVKH